MLDTHLGRLVNLPGYLCFSPRQLGEVGEVAERGDGFGLGDEGTDAQGVQEAEVVGVLGRLGEGEDLVLLAELQAAVDLEALRLKVVVFEGLGDALAGLRPEVAAFIALNFDQQGATLVRMYG